VDPHEACLLEMIGKRDHELGTVWVSCQVSEGTILAHANHARIAQFWDNQGCTHSDDVVDFAISLGLYTNDGDYSDFSFDGTYDLKKSFQMRYTDARVWDGTSIAHLCRRKKRRNSIACTLTM
jgi:dipeptidase